MNLATALTWAFLVLSWLPLWLSFYLSPQSDPEFLQWTKELRYAYSEAQQLLQRVPKMKHKPRSPVVELSKVPLIQRSSSSTNGLWSSLMPPPILNLFGWVCPPSPSSLLFLFADRCDVHPSPLGYYSEGGIQKVWDTYPQSTWGLIPISGEGTQGWKDE